MDTNQRLRDDLVKTRHFTERLLADFQAPADWVLQVHPQANHALWLVGHIGHADNFFLSLLEPAQVEPRPVYREKFGTGSQPSARLEDYPPPEEVLAWMRDRRAHLLEVLEPLSESDLAQPTPAGSPEFLADRASVFRTANWHECIHAGQLSVARRALGLPPLEGSPESPLAP